jgi:hypothetical protein
MLTQCHKPSQKEQGEGIEGWCLFEGVSSAAICSVDDAVL